MANSLLTPVVAVRALIPAVFDQKDKGPKRWALGARGFAAGTGREIQHAIGGAFASEFIANQWLPHAEPKASAALWGIGLKFGVTPAVNLVSEFSPEWKRLVKRRK